MTGTCWILGVLDAGPDYLTPAAVRILGQAELLIADSRFLDLFAHLAPPEAEQRSLNGRLAELPGWIQQAQAQNRQVVVLATGDPLCFGVGGYLLRHLPANTCHILGNVSTLQRACELLGLAWGDAVRLSVHAKDSGVWRRDSGPEHALFPLRRALLQAAPITLLTSPANTPARIADMLVTLRLDLTWEMAVAQRLGHPDESITHWMPPSMAQTKSFADPHVVVLRRSPSGQIAPATLEAPILGISDAVFQKRTPDRGLITRREIRVVVLAHLGLQPHSQVWDIGAGSGSVGLEAARLAPLGAVHAVEMHPECIRMIQENRQQLGVTNHFLRHAKAPDGLDAWPDPDAIFIGGSGGVLTELISLCWQRLRPDGHMVMNFATLENLHTATNTMDRLGAPWEMIQLQLSRTRPIGAMHRLAGENPVWIVTTTK
ncbi:MAG: precorrin-6y C5,15-methyltransferase (decarboxylating) subunit CbiE [Magnetococcales bacterium]|nr:precorrin-6y C5,15-methyltransferase (decarboxylating) subunit CbiE [Magnetococcales bacterium]